MKRIEQREVSDCGVCCIAMLVGKSYDEVKQKIFLETEKIYNIEFEKLKEIFNQLGFETTVYNEMPESQKNGLLEIEYKKNGLRVFHYIVYYAMLKSYIDPQKVSPAEYKKLRFLEIE